MRCQMLSDVPCACRLPLQKFPTAQSLVTSMQYTGSECPAGLWVYSAYAARAWGKSGPSPA